MDENGEVQEQVVPEASLDELSDFLSSQDISRLLETVRRNIGLASDGMP